MKNRTTAAILALFLGGVGAHKFYLGRWVWGLVYLAFCVTLIPALVALIEAIILFSMKDDDFHRKYNDPLSVADIPTPESHVRCPDCRELVRNDARKCKHCGCSLIPIG